MPATLAPGRKTDRPPFECRVRFPARLTDAVLVPPDAPLPAPAPRPAAASPVPAEPVSQDAPPPADFWQTDVARELAADRTRVEAALAEIQRAVGDLRADQAGRLRELQRVAVELAATIATRLIHERVAAGDFPMEAKVRDMIDQLDQDVPVAVYLNPADLDLLEARLGGAPLRAGRDDPRLAPDPDLARGAVRLEGKESDLLSDLTRELQEIRDDLLRSLGNARS